MSSRRGKWYRQGSDAPMRLTLLLTTMCASASANNATTMPPTKECVEARLPPVKREVKLAVIAPADPRHEQSLPRVLPAVLLAVRAVSSAKGPLPGWRIKVDHRDSRCSSTYGPLAAFDFYINRTAGHLSFFGGFLHFPIRDPLGLLPIFFRWYVIDSGLGLMGCRVWWWRGVFVSGLGVLGTSFLENDKGIWDNRYLVVIVLWEIES